MKKFGVVLLAIVLSAIALSACTPQPAVYTDDSQPISVGVGQTFTIQLASNPTTGFDWAATFDAKVLSQVSKDYAGTGTAVGSGGTATFVFKGVAAGTTDLVLKYFRSFEPPTTAPAQTKTFKVTVK